MVRRTKMPRCNLKFKIGDRVKILDYNNLPEKHKRFIQLFQASGASKERYLETTMTIARIMYSETYSEWAYRMEEDDEKFVWPDAAIAYEISKSIHKERGTENPMPFI